jgi:hypothetical protein
MVKLFSVQSLGGSSSDVTSSSTLVIDVDLESDLLRLAKGVSFHQIYPTKSTCKKMWKPIVSLGK